MTFLLVANVYQPSSLIGQNPPAASQTSPGSPPWGGTSCACSWPTRSGRRPCGGSSWSSSWSSSTTMSTSAYYWPRGRNASRSRRSRGGGWRRLDKSSLLSICRKHEAAISIFCPPHFVWIESHGSHIFSSVAMASNPNTAWKPQD